MKYQEIKGDLIKLAKKGKFDVIVHGCNCFCTMGAGIAVPMKNAFGCDKFELERRRFRGDHTKLGLIDYEKITVGGAMALTVVNAYTQYRYSGRQPVDYDAMQRCMQAINTEFAGQHIGLPMIGCGLAGGSWSKVSKIIRDNLKDCTVTIVKL